MTLRLPHLTGRAPKGITVPDDDFEPHVMEWPIGGVMLDDDGCPPEEHVWGRAYVLPDVVPSTESDRRACYAGCTRCAAMIRLEPPPLDMHDHDAVQKWLDS